MPIFLALLLLIVERQRPTPARTTRHATGHFALTSGASATTRRGSRPPDRRTWDQPVSMSASSCRSTKYRPGRAAAAPGPGERCLTSCRIPARKPAPTSVLHPLVGRQQRLLARDPGGPTMALRPGAVRVPAGETSIEAVTGPEWRHVYEAVACTRSSSSTARMIAAPGCSRTRRGERLLVRRTPCRCRRAGPSPQPSRAGRCSPHRPAPRYVAEFRALLSHVPDAAVAPVTGST